MFIEIRKRLGDKLLGQMNLRILEIANADKDNKPAKNRKNDDQGEGTHKGVLLPDASVAPRDIAYPTDFNLLNEVREITEKIIDTLPWIVSIILVLNLVKLPGKTPLCLSFSANPNYSKS